MDDDLGVPLFLETAIYRGEISPVTRVLTPFVGLISPFRGQKLVIFSINCVVFWRKTHPKLGSQKARILEKIPYEILSSLSRDFPNTNTSKPLKIGRALAQ